MRILSDHARRWMQLAAQKLEKRGFASTVRSDERETCVEVDTELQVLVDVRRCVVVTEADVLDHDDRRRNRSARWKVEIQHLVVGRLLSQSRRDHLRQRLLLRLSLPS